MHICFVALSYPADGKPSNGVASQVGVLANALRERGDSVSIVTLGGKPTFRIDVNGINIHCLTTSKLHWYATKLPMLGKLLALPLRELEFSVAARRGVRDVNRKHKIDVIEGTETGMLATCLRGSIPIVIRLHGEQYTFHRYTPPSRIDAGVRLSRMLQRIGLRRAALLISPSHAHAKEIQDELRQKHPPVRVIPNSIGLTETDSTERQSSLVAFVGRFERVKGLTVFLEAAALIRRDYPEVRFIVAGAPHASISQDEIDAILNEGELHDCLEWCGLLAKDDLARLYRRATVCVVSSFYESFGLVALEALAAGAPVIASRVGGLPELVQDRVNGRLIDPGNVEGFAAAVLELLRNPKEGEQLSEAARLHARTYRVDQNLPASIQAYQDVLWQTEGRQQNPALMPQPESQLH